MFGLAEIKRMNDAAVIEDQFPDHDCTNSLAVDEMLASDYVLRDEYADVLDDHRELFALVQELIAKMPENDMADVLDKRDYTNRAEVHSRGYDEIGH